MGRKLKKKAPIRATRGQREWTPSSDRRAQHRCAARLYDELISKLRTTRVGHGGR
jgi:hypothetical protein